MLPTVKYLAQDFGSNTIKSIQSKNAVIHKIHSPKTEIEQMRFNCSVNFYSELIDTLRVNMKPLYDLLQENFKPQCSKILETLLQQSKTSVAKNSILTLANINRPFFITVDSSLFGIGCVLFQKIEKGKLDVNSNNSRFFSTDEQKLCTT